MKRLAVAQQQRNIMLARKRCHRNIKRKKYRRHLRALAHLGRRENIPRQEMILRDYHVSAPENFNLREDFDEAVIFLQTIRQESLKRRKRYSINFKTIQTLSPAAALLLTAEMDRWRRTTKMKLVPAELKKWNPDVRRLLNEMGFFEALGMENPCGFDDLIEDENLKFIKFMSGSTSDGTYVKELRIALEKLAGAINAKIYMYNGVTEAMANSVEHAYPPPQKFPNEIYKRWWISGSYNKENGRITVMVYDQGVGIPTTLPVSRFRDLVSSFLGTLSLSATDGNMIRAAMQIGRTQTGAENRGLGLNEMRDFIVRSERGTLRIISCKGDYIFYHNEKEEVKEHDVSLGGTLIAWEIFIKDDQNPVWG